MKLTAAEMNASIHAATGYRPDEVQFGRPTRRLIDTLMPDVIGSTHVGSLAGALRGIRDHLEEITSNI